MISSSNRALVVEDDVSWQQILNEILSDMDLVVDLVSHLEDAVRSLKSESHRLAVVDLSLAGGDHDNFDGLRVLDAAKRLDPNCQTILLTGFATVELAVSALTEYGAFTFLRKENFNRTGFRDLVDRALAIAPHLDSEEAIPVEISIGSELNSSKQTGSQDTRVLVVDDDSGWRSILSELLIDNGYKVQLCNSFGEALGYLLREKFILSIIDLSLNGEFNWELNKAEENLDGYQLLAAARSVGIPSIVVSGITTPNEIKRAYSDHSIFAYIEKQTFDRNVFRRLVEEAAHSNQVPSSLDCLTDRELEVFDLLARGLTNKEIAEALAVSTNTVKRHIKAIFEKLDVHTRSAATAKAVSYHYKT